jgi:hypothetical protein
MKYEQLSFPVIRSANPAEYDSSPPGLWKHDQVTSACPQHCLSYEYVELNSKAPTRLLHFVWRRVNLLLPFLDIRFS